MTLKYCLLSPPPPFLARQEPKKSSLEDSEVALPAPQELGPPLFDYTPVRFGEALLTAPFLPLMSANQQPVHVHPPYCPKPRLGSARRAAPPLSDPSTLGQSPSCCHSGHPATPARCPEFPPSSWNPHLRCSQPVWVVFGAARPPQCGCHW